MKRKAYYPVTYTQYKIFIAISGAQWVSISNAFLGPIPERIIIAMVKNPGFVCSASTNPVLLYYYYYINLVLYANGFQHLSVPVKMDSYSPFGANRSYETLFSNTGIHHDDRIQMITLEMFTNDFYILGFDLTQDREADEEHISPPPIRETCALGHDLKNLPKPVTCLLYAEFPGHVEINKLRNITVE